MTVAIHKWTQVPRIGHGKGMAAYGSFRLTLIAEWFLTWHLGKEDLV